MSLDDLTQPAPDLRAASPLAERDAALRAEAGRGACRGSFARGGQEDPDHRHLRQGWDRQVVHARQSELHDG